MSCSGLSSAKSTRRSLPLALSRSIKGSSSSRRTPRAAGADLGPGRQHVDVEGQVEAVAAGSEGVQLGADGVQGRLADLAVLTHQHAQLGGAGKQRAGVAGAAYP